MIIYVTDYTARTDLAPVAATIAPTALTGRIVRIVLSDAQVETGKQLAPGDFVAIRNLRLRTTCGTLLSGRLGGDQRLITKLNPKKGGNAELNALLARKRDFEGASVSEEQARSGKGGTAARAARKAAAAEVAEARAAAASSSKPVVKHQEKLDGDQTVAKKHATKEQQHVLLSDVKASEACPAVFRVRVRAVDFYPDDLRRCVIFRCTSCEKTCVLSPRSAHRDTYDMATDYQAGTGYALAATTRWKTRRPYKASSSCISASQTRMARH